MRRLILCSLSFASALLLQAGWLAAQTPSTGVSGPKLKTLAVPASQARSLATKLSLQYRDVPEVKISPDVRNERLVVMAPEKTQAKIAADLQGLLEVQQVSARTAGPLRFDLTYITWREFEDDLQRLVGKELPVTTSRNGERAAFQLVASPMQGTTVEVDRRNNTVTVIAPQPSQPGWKKMLAALDRTPAGPGSVTEMMRLENAEPAPIQRALRLLQELESSKTEGFAATPVGENSPFRNAVFQQGVDAAQGDADALPPADIEGDATGAADDQGGSGVIGDTQIQFVPELGTIIIRGSKRDVQRVMDVIKEIEAKSELTKPDVQVLKLEHADSNAVATLLQQLYEDVLSARQGDVSITSLDSNNALLLIGREEAIMGLMDLIKKIDQPVEDKYRLRVFRLRNASAVDAEQTIRDFFTDRPAVNDDVRPGLGMRVRVLADYRTNSLIISAAPRDMVEITRLINELDVEKITAQNEIKVFQLSNAIAEELAPVLQTAINGEGDAEVNDNLTSPSTSLSIIAVDANGESTVDSGILAGAVVTADAGANAIVVRAPAASMSLIGELIRQLDRAPGIDSLVKVFTIQNGDATQLTTALQTLFGEDAGTVGTSVGGANAAGLPPSTAGAESSLVPLRFSQDIRTNSIIASGAEEDLEVVESILLRLDSEGFAERITEVIWLRHQAAEAVATALQDYVLQRTNGVNRIQQYQQGGLGPFDLADRDLVVASHFESNSLLISVSPRLYEEVRGLIDSLDRRPPMVLIKVMIAEVRLDDAFEIGGELGLQDSLLYDRGVAAGGFPGATLPSDPGFDFNENGLQQFDADGNPLGNSFLQGTVAARALSTFGVGTTNSAVGYGGFVLSAASDSVSVLLRTLQDAARLQILSRPQIMTMDNTQGYVQVGREIARVTDVINNGVAGTQVVTEDREVGLIMQVLPRVGADGLIVMDIDATRSDRDDSNGTVVPTGDGGTVFINDILRTTAQSTIAAYSGQTVIFGGLIQKVRSNVSRRVPWVSNIPLLGYFFKYEQEAEIRSELLVIMTPMLVDGDEDMEYVKQVESSRMSWCLADVVEAHGDVGLSGGYGLWGPAVGQTIYPDLQPTVDHQRYGPSTTIDGAAGQGVHIPSNPIVDSTMIDSGLEPTPGNFLPPTSEPPVGEPVPAPGSLFPTAPVEDLPTTLPDGGLRSSSTGQPRSLPPPINTIGQRQGQPSTATPRVASRPGFALPGNFSAAVMPTAFALPQSATTPSSATAATAQPEPAVAQSVEARWAELTGQAAASGATTTRPQPKRLGEGK